MDYYFLKGGGFISDQLKSMDWDNHSIGSMENWPNALKVSLSNCLNSPFPMLICWGPEMIMLYNVAYADFLEDPVYALGKPIREIWTDIWDEIGPLLQSVRSTGKPVSLKDQLFPLIKNGTKKERFFTFSYSRILDGESDGGILAVTYETTENILNYRMAKLEQEKIQRIFSQSPTAVCILDGPDLVFELINENYQQLFPGRNLFGKPILEALPELKGHPIEDILSGVYHTGTTFKGTELSVPLSRSEGGPVEDRYFDFIYQARLNVNKEIDGIIVFAYEVTKFIDARRSAEQLAARIEQQAKLFDVTLASIKDFVYAFDLEGRFTYSNTGLLGLLGITLDQIIGKNFHDLPYPEELASRLQSQIEQVIVTGNPVTDETVFLSPEGKEGHYEYIFTPVFDDDGQVVLVAGSTRDVSERKKSEEAINLKNEELTQLNHQLMRVNSDLDNFIYTASHDLKSPIANIEGLVNVLTDHLSQQTRQNSEVDDLIRLMRNSVKRFNRTIHDLSDITKLQRLNDEEEISVNLEEVIEGIKMDLSFMLKDARGQIQLDLGSSKFIDFSPKNLRSVFYNLISNSLKYRSSSRDAAIKISAEEDQDFDIITVEDNGMDLSKGPSIFGMFQRLHNHVEGSGVGLYIVKKIMENAEGKIEVESKIGIGSVFKLYFKKNRFNNRQFYETDHSVR